MLKNIILLCICITAYCNIIAQKSNCNYFNISKPTIIPKDFNPKLLDLNGSFKFNVEIGRCNEIYFTTKVGANEDIYFSEKENNTWSKPKIASFSDIKYNDADPFLTKDGKRMYFISKRPTNKDDKKLDFNIWYSDRKNNNWEKPKPLPKPINSDEYNEYFFSISEKGNAFFSSNRKGGKGSFDIYTVKVLGNNKFSEPKNIGHPLNTKNYEFDPYISPDESFIIFSINKKGNSSLYFSSKDKSGAWRTPKNLGKSINITRQDFAPSLSPDGKFIFYSNNGKLRWISVEVLKTLNE